MEYYDTGGVNVTKYILHTKKTTTDWMELIFWAAIGKIFF